MVYHSNNPLAWTNDPFIITTINAIAFIVVDSKLNRRKCAGGNSVMKDSHRTTQMPTAPKIAIAFIGAVYFKKIFQDMIE
jgi:hypothetical protein